MNTHLAAIFKGFLESHNDSPLTVDTERVSDKFLVDKLRSFGIHINKDSLAKLGKTAVALGQIADALVEKHVAEDRRDKNDVDWIFVCVAELWKRWFPDDVLFEMLADRIERVYDLMEMENETAACRVWFKTWPHILRFFDKCGVKTAGEFRKRFPKYVDVLHWMEHLSWELTRDEDGDRLFVQPRIAFCEQALKRLSPNDERDYVIDGFRELLTRSYCIVGEIEKADALYRRWLDKDPYWISGWITWSCCHKVDWNGSSDIQRVEQILREGLAAFNARIDLPISAAGRHRDDLLLLLVYVLEEQGRQNEADAVRQEMNQSMKSRHATASFIDASPEIGDAKDQHHSYMWKLVKREPGKVRRKEPCPCGSGDLFKRCCGRARSV